MKLQKKDFNWAAPGIVSADKQNIAIIGGTAGIGRAIALSLAEKGAQVTVYGRTFRDQGTPGLNFEKVDLALMQNAKALASNMPAGEIDLLIFTNGIMSTPQKVETSEGLEMDLAVSYLSRLAILDVVAPRLGANRPNRSKVFIMGFPGTGQNLVDVSDLNSDREYKLFPAHMKTVVGNEALVLETAKRYDHISVFGLNPGLIKTGIRSNFLGDGTLKHKIVEGLIGWFTPSAGEYAKTLLPLFFSPDLDKVSGFHFNQKAMAIKPSENMTETYVVDLMTASRELIEKAVKDKVREIKIG